MSRRVETREDVVNSGKSLREKAYENVSKERSVFSSVVPGIRSAPVVDCSQPVRFFLEDTPEESGFSIGDIPLLGGVEWLYRGNGGVFLETQAPPEEGLMWGALLTSVVDHSDIVSSIIGSARGLGVDCEIREGNPGMALLAPGAVKRAGVFVSVDKPLSDEDREAFYDSLFSDIVDLEDLRCVLQLTLFVELGAEVSEDAEDSADVPGELIEPAMMWYLPVTREGEALAFSGEADEMKLFAPGVGDLAQLEDVVDFVAQAQRPLILATLFSLACAGASNGGTPSSPRLAATGSDTLGPAYSLNVTGLSRMLEIEGRASDLGLSHALTVCRGEFEAV